MHAISSYRGNRPTNKHTNTPTHKQTGPITIHCAAAKLSAQCKIRIVIKEMEIKTAKNQAYPIISLDFIFPIIACRPTA